MNGIDLILLLFIGAALALTGFFYAKYSYWNNKYRESIKSAAETAERLADLRKQEKAAAERVEKIKRQIAGKRGKL